jgi:hypothetical protein
MTAQLHNIIEHVSGQYECRVCAQTWTSQPESSCPGVKVYPKNAYDPLMTIKQLSSNGYKTSTKFLPPHVGCYLGREAESYTLLYDPEQAVKRVNQSRPMMAHDIVRYGPGQFECRVCFKIWEKRPQTACPGLKVYERYDHAPLMTKEELNFMGYYATPKKLPPEAGYFYKGSAARYLPLYDPAQAVLKPHSAGIPNLVTAILWPLSCLSLLETLADMESRTLSDEERVRAQELFIEIANIAALTKIYTRTELEQIHGGFVEFNIPPTTLHRFYPTPRGIVSEQRRLQTNLLIAYRRYKAQTVIVF